jgi:agmatinase
MNTPSFLEGEFPQSSREEARFHIFQVPWEGTVSYKGGTAGGPAAILDASTQLEAAFDSLSPGKEKFYTHPPLDCRMGREAIFGELRSEISRSLARPDTIPVVLGGEHSITFPVLQAFAEHYQSAASGLPAPLGVIQFDAHADLRDAYEGNPYSHASVMRRIHQDLGVPIFQLGVRASCTEEREYRRQHGIPYVDGREMERSNYRKVELPADFPPDIYVTFDVDGLDPSIMPATGTPVPGGIGWYQTLDLLESILPERRIVGFDVVELAPVPGLHAPDFLAAELVHRMMGLTVKRS